MTATPVLRRQCGGIAQYCLSSGSKWRSQMFRSVSLLRCVPGCSWRVYDLPECLTTSFVHDNVRLDSESRRKAFSIWSELNPSFVPRWHQPSMNRLRLALPCPSQSSPRGKGSFCRQKVGCSERLRLVRYLLNCFWSFWGRTWFVLKVPRWLDRCSSCYSLLIRLDHLWFIWLI